jgi:hypothetical protein
VKRSERKDKRDFVEERAEEAEKAGIRRYLQNTITS